jgi:hypothetical protein
MFFFFEYLHWQDKWHDADSILCKRFCRVVRPDSIDEMQHVSAPSAAGVIPYQGHSVRSFFYDRKTRIGECDCGLRLTDGQIERVEAHVSHGQSCGTEEFIRNEMGTNHGSRTQGCNKDQSILHVRTRVCRNIIYNFGHGWNSKGKEATCTYQT